MAEPYADDRVLEGVPRLRWHLVGLVAVLLALWPLLDFRGVFSSDEGSYGVQVAALGEGSWNMGYAFSGADPDGELQPYHGADVAGAVVVPYASHPLWPSALRGASIVVGQEAGLRLWGVLSAALAASIAWSLAGELGARGGRPLAFWAVAASPVLANAWIGWAHAPSAAAGGLLALGLVRARRAPWLLVAAGGAALGVLLRSEGLLWAGAAAAAALLAGPTLRLRVGGLIIGAAAGGALLVERVWRSSILDLGTTEPGTVDSSVRVRSAGASLADRLSGLRIAVFDGALGSSVGRLLGLVVVVAVAATVWWWTRGDLRRGVIALGLGGLALAVRVGVALDDPAPGLLVAAPSLLLAALWRPAERRDAVIPLALGLFVAALAGTIYVDGGSFQWGGRFLSPIVPLLGALAGAGVDRLRRTSSGPVGMSRGGRVAPLGALLVVLVVQATGAVLIPDHMRRATADAVESVITQGPEVFITEGGQVARLDWRGWPERCWIALPAGGDAADMGALVRVLARTGVREAAYGGVDPELMRDAGLDPGPDAGRVGVVAIPGQVPDAEIAFPYTCSPG